MIEDPHCSWSICGRKVSAVVVGGKRSVHGGSMKILPQDTVESNEAVGVAVGDVSSHETGGSKRMQMKSTGVGDVGDGSDSHPVRGLRQSSS